MLALTMSTVSVMAAPHHRNHLKITATSVVDTTQAQGVAAYSDTTAAHAQTPVMAVDADDDDDADDLVDASSAAGGFLHGLSDFNDSILPLVFVVAILIFLAFPFIVLIVLLRYLFKRSKARMELAQKAIEKGQPIPETVCGKRASAPADLWRTGIRNVSIGAGLVLMFAIWGSAFLTGIGALVLCYGVGQLVIVKTSTPADGGDTPADDDSTRDDHDGAGSDGCENAGDDCEDAKDGCENAKDGCENAGDGDGSTPDKL